MYSNNTYIGYIWITPELVLKIRSECETHFNFVYPKNLTLIYLKSMFSNPSMQLQHWILLIQTIRVIWNSSTQTHPKKIRLLVMLEANGWIWICCV